MDNLFFIEGNQALLPNISRTTILNCKEGEIGTFPDLQVLMRLYFCQEQSVQIHLICGMLELCS